MKQNILVENARKMTTSKGRKGISAHGTFEDHLALTLAFMRGEINLTAVARTVYPDGTKNPSIGGFGGTSYALMCRTLQTAIMRERVEIIDLEDID